MIKCWEWDAVEMMYAIFREIVPKRPPLSPSSVSHAQAEEHRVVTNQPTWPLDCCAQRPSLALEGT